ncbi:MAG: alpha/beta hydrolase-fold protein [Gemmatimonadota bacterium]|nr:alpha/beta hydrolase-fold protein [Gemmatimonadota bacterium]
MSSSATGREYQVSIALPLGYYESNEAYSVLVGVDANGQFGTLTETARLLRLGSQIPPLVVVGIGYPMGGYQSVTRPRRLHEFYPTAIDDYVQIMAEAFPDSPPPFGSGGGPELLDFIANDALPYVDSHYRTRPTGRALYGHSAGGAFAFYSLLHSEGAFSRYIIASPAFWYDDRVAFRIETAHAAQHRELPARAFFSVGLLETEDSSPPLGSGRMISNLRDMLNVLTGRDYEGFQWDSHFFEDENHQSVIGPSISRGLRYIYAEGAAG